MTHLSFCTLLCFLHPQVLLSAIPCYGILRHQFISVTSIFFEKNCESELDFTNFLLSVSNPTTGVLHREAGVQVSSGNKQR